MGLFTAVASLFGGETRSVCNDKNRQPAEPRPKPTVLVIDDDANFLQMMRTLLGRAGYGVLTSTTGPKGLDTLRYASHDLAVVLLAFNMPRFNGSDTLEHLRRLNGRVKVIGISGLKESELPKNFRTRVDRFVAKPFSNGELLQAIENVLGAIPQ